MVISLNLIMAALFCSWKRALYSEFHFLEDYDKV